MDAKNLLDQHFETAFSAPDGIKLLRELILTLAMRGQLILQNPADQPARELLGKIEAEKQELIKAGKLKKSKPLPPIKPEETPYELPESWEWVRLGNLVEILNGRAYKKNEMLLSGTPVLRVGNLFTSNQLPPLAEQKRLVEKIDCLMEQCDQLERLRTKQQEIQTALLNSIMAKF